MEAKLIQIVIILGVILIVNRLVVPWMVSGVVRYHKQYNTENLDKGPVRFLIKHEHNLIRVFKMCYWFGGGAVVARIVIG